MEGTNEPGHWAGAFSSLIGQSMILGRSEQTGRPNAYQPYGTSGKNNHFVPFGSPKKNFAGPNMITFFVSGTYIRPSGPRMIMT